MTLADLAAASDTRPDRLLQILHVLCCKGIFHYDLRNQSFNNNHISTLLLSSDWTQWREWVTLYGNKFYDIARGIPGSVKKNISRSAAQINFETNENMFTYFQNQGWLPQHHCTLGAGTTIQTAGILVGYPWADIADESIMDIGGGGGSLTGLLLRGNPKNDRWDLRPPQRH